MPIPIGYTDMTNHLLNKRVICMPDGTNHEVKEIWIGGADGANHKVWSSNALHISHIYSRYSSTYSAPTEIPIGASGSGKNCSYTLANGLLTLNVYGNHSDAHYSDGGESGWYDTDYIYFTADFEQPFVLSPKTPLKWEVSKYGGGTAYLPINHGGQIAFPPQFQISGVYYGDINNAANGEILSTNTSDVALDKITVSLDNYAPGTTFTIQIRSGDISIGGVPLTF